jgi:ribosomal protein L40E
MADATEPRGGVPRPHAEEEKISKAIAFGLPLVTLATAGVVGIVMGPATSILVLAAGLILGVITLLWGSLRILTGDAPLSPELEALDMDAHGVDALASRKKMLIRALKDLENERGIGKIETEDYEPIAQTYREELKVVLRRMDESLAPHRAKAEDVARLYLAKAGLDRDGDGDGDAKDDASTRDLDKSRRSRSLGVGGVSPLVGPEPQDVTTQDEESPARVVCPKCDASNEVDAKFCKECATSLASAKKTKPADGDDDDDDDDDEDDDEE